MPDVSYTVVIKDERDTEEEKKKTASTPSGSADPKSDTNVKLPPQLRKVASIGFAINALDTVASFRINTVELRTGNSTYQARATAMHDIAKGVVNSGMTMLGAFAAFGPIGAAVAGVSMATTAMIQHAREVQQYNIRSAINSYEVELANIRAGAYGNRGGRDR